MKTLSLIAAVAGLLMPAFAFAQSAAPATPAAPSTAAVPSAPDAAARGKFRAACGGDIVKFCAADAVSATTPPDQVKAQRGKMRACMTAHQTDLSADCKAVILERDAEQAAKKS